MEPATNATSNKSEVDEQVKQIPQKPPKTLDIVVKNAETGEIIIAFQSDIVIFGAVLKDFAKQTGSHPEDKTVPVEIINIGLPFQQSQLLSYINGKVGNYLAASLGAFTNGKTLKVSEGEEKKDVEA